MWVTDEELTAIAADLGKPLGEVRLLHTKLMGGRWSLRDYPNGDCVFLAPPVPPVPSLRRAADAMPDVAILAVEH